MIWLITLCGAGLLSGFLLMTRVPLCRLIATKKLQPSENEFELDKNSVAIIIPARNEEKNLPRLLSSIPSFPGIAEVIVVDDNSTDRTPTIAGEFHARIINPGEPPAQFTGKTWACACGAESSSAANLLFLDADTFFEPNGLAGIIQAFTAQPPASALSVLPFAVTEKPYEELSLFFNLLMAFGAGGFGILQSPRLFGQSLLLPRSLYHAAGGHASVGPFVLENFHLSHRLEAAKGRSVCLGGRGTLHMRMFPGGLSQLCDGWTKAFADGAQATDPRTLFVAIVWLSLLAAIALAVVLVPQHLRLLALLLYILATSQIIFFARQIGTFRLITCLLFPVPLVFFFIVFARSAIRRATHRSTNWRGRNV